MISDALALLGMQGRCQAAKLRALSAPLVALCALLGPAVGYLLSTMLFEPMWASYSTGQSYEMLARVAEVIATGAAAYAFPFSIAFPSELQEFAHRMSPAGLALNRVIRATLIAGGAATLGIVVIGWGTDLGVAGWTSIIAAELPAGLIIGLGFSMSAEWLARAWVHKDSSIAVARVASMCTGIAAITVIVTVNRMTPWLFVAALIILVLALRAGTAPLRREWLPLGGRPSRRSTQRSLGRMVSLNRVAIVLLLRDRLAVPTSLAMVLVISAVGVVVRIDGAAVVADLYLAGWPLLVAEVAGAAGITAVMKLVPIGGGLYGHRWRPRGVAIAGLGAAVLMSMSTACIAAVVTTVSTGILPNVGEITTLVAMVMVAALSALVLGALFRVSPDAAELPIPLAITYLAAASAFVSLFNATTGVVTGLVTATLVAAATTGVIRSLRRHAPFTV